MLYIVLASLANRGISWRGDIGAPFSLPAKIIFY